jgi:hypothetical protein
MFSDILRAFGIIGGWAFMAWLSLFLLSMLGMGVESSSEAGIISFGVVAFVTSVTMEIRDWLRLNRVVVEKR